MDSEARAQVTVPEAPEREQGRAPPDEERIQQLLQELEPLARRIARRWARDRPGAEDDLAQEIRIALWLLLKERPNAPFAYLARAAKYTALDQRKRGKSVDGRLDPNSERSRSWTVLSLESLEGSPPASPLAPTHSYGHPAGGSPTEGEAVGRVLYQELRSTLTLREDVYLALLLMGYRHKDAGKVLGLTKKQVGYIQQVLRRKFNALLEGREDGDRLSPQSTAAQRAARARWDKRPFRIPKDIQALLEWFTTGDE